jgi:diguanylate cyclase (GGDEF)-like protein/PAS domain S-box-containing protein
MASGSSIQHENEKINLKNAAKLDYELSTFLFEHSLQAVLFLQEKKIIYANTRMADLIGYPYEKILDSSPRELIDFIHPVDRQAIIEHWTEHKAKLPTPANIELRLNHPEGKETWVEVYSDTVLLHGIPTERVALIEISSRKQAEASLLLRDAVLEVIAQAAQRFMTASGWKSQLHWLLRELGKAVKVSRVYFFENDGSSGEAQYASQIDEWCEKGITPQINNPGLQNIPLRIGWFSTWAKKLERDKPMSGIVREMSLQSQNELLPQDIKSLLVIPVHSDGHWVGFIGFDDCISERIWGTVEMETLQTAASLLGNAIHHQQVSLALKKANEDLIQWNKTLENLNRVANLLNEYGELFQNCISEEDLYAIVRTFGNALYPHSDGALYIVNNSRAKMEAKGIWGTLPPQEVIFDPMECWGFRRGHLHRSSNRSTGMKCQHIISNDDGQDEVLYLCAPIIAQANTLGVLHIQTHTSQPIDQVEALTTTVADRIGVTLNNLWLRENLRQQSIRDPLTNLFNRRYLEETLERELRRAARYQRPLGIIMFDIDFFKRYNDTYGHEAGDQVLHALGQFLQSHLRAEDIACRYGGEEFVLLLIESSLNDTCQRAETIREGISKVQVEFQDRFLEPIHLSGGVAAFPEHGISSMDLIRAADKALYAAKHHGRNQVVSADL